MKMIPATLLAIFILHSTTKTLLAQSPAQSPAPPVPTNVTAIIEKASQFTTFIRLLRSTQMESQINTALGNSNQGLTIFVPTDNAFNSLKPGTLNSLSDQQKVQLMQFHVVPTYLTTDQFQTVTNPLRTQVGGNGDFPLNITTSGNQVNITTGLTNTTVSNTIYTDGQLAVYQVDQVLLPIGVFSPSSPPALAPVVAKGKKKGHGSSGSDDGGGSSNGVKATASHWLGGMVFMSVLVLVIKI
ncbi:fasciclin-like arabinogalactan protein 11 [Impatiens glandulifera]|uniref:fasciclin-like arabinogalactan protein 11 n=1 Tax=Impatiens glandulifera TaxID=253017 RepID=UPI001FB15B64|nr:fasciclin-like arabinogalactan protein 11 [Impatiens glandulifera]